VAHDEQHEGADGQDRHQQREADRHSRTQATPPTESGDFECENTNRKER
jgi:hypothetical protein